MPRNRLIAQLEQELVYAKSSLAFWQAQTILMTEDELLASIQTRIQHREAEIGQLLAAHEVLIRAPDA